MAQKSVSQVRMSSSTDVTFTVVNMASCWGIIGTRTKTYLYNYYVSYFINIYQQFLYLTKKYIFVTSNQVFVSFNACILFSDCLKVFLTLFWTSYTTYKRFLSPEPLVLASMMLLLSLLPAMFIALIENLYEVPQSSPAAVYVRFLGPRLISCHTSCSLRCRRLKSGIR